MLILFIPYYNEDSPEFKESLKNSTVQFGGDTHANRILRWDRRLKKIYWSRACNDFLKEIKRWRGLKDEDVICIMNNDISFPPEFLEEGMQVRPGQIYSPEFVSVNWKKKQFKNYNDPNIINDILTFPGRLFFMTVKDFKNSGGFSKLIPHYLSDYDFGLRMLKKHTPVLMKNKITHDNHGKVRGFKIHSVNNPVFWTIFLLKHPNIYTLINIIKAWIDTWRAK